MWTWDRVFQCKRMPSSGDGISLKMASRTPVAFLSSGFGTLMINPSCFTNTRRQQKVLTAGNGRCWVSLLRNDTQHFLIK